MQAERDQQAVQETIDAGAKRAKRDDPGTERMKPILNWRPDIAKDDTQHHRCQTGNDGDETPTTEEAQVIRQAKGVEAAIQTASHPTPQEDRKHNPVLDGHT